jgi:hypothetical protein
VNRNGYGGCYWDKFWLEFGWELSLGVETGWIGDEDDRERSKGTQRETELMVSRRGSRRV